LDKNRKYHIFEEKNTTKMLISTVIQRFFFL